MNSLLITGLSLAAAYIKYMAIGARTEDENHIPVKGESDPDVAKLSPIVMRTK